MLINQISVFLENKPGKLSEFVNLLADNKIDLEALSIAEAQDYGVARIIVDKPAQLKELLTEKGWPCTSTPVLAANVPDEPGSLTKILSVLADSNVSIEYSYAFFSRNSGPCVVLRVEDNEVAQKLLNNAGITC